ncbi:uncharacterized protein LOC141852183 [Brevipalpus obovatus]|uniref:uncharacterized protein LOC141852183 n=1 Tax=Brevipalpus obovatus TaxID=246614 RepID=UPI003D9E158B
MFSSKKSNHYPKAARTSGQTKIRMLAITLGVLCLVSSIFVTASAGPAKSEHAMVDGLCKVMKFVAGDKDHHQFKTTGKKCAEELLPPSKKDVMKCPKVVKFWGLLTPSDVDQFCAGKYVQQLVDDCLLKHGLDIAYLSKVEECMMSKHGKSDRFLKS